jgi:hypothetical protein
LEVGLLQIIDKLFDMTKSPFPLDFCYPRLPSQYGWKNPVPEEHRARSRALKSRDAFFPLMALCSYLIVLNLPPEESNAPHPSWAEYLVQHKVHPEWVDGLKHSEIANFSAPRVGAVLHAGECQWLNHVRWLVRGNVPVWIYWGTTKAMVKPTGPMGLNCRPSDAEIEDALYRRSAEEASSRWELPEDDTITPSPMGAAIPDPPQPERFSRQQRGETWQQYFARQEARRPRIIAAETEVTRMSRQNREAASRTNRPGRKGARVFQWVLTDGFRMRQNVFRSQVDDVWDSYNSNQRRYDSFNDEWDICTEFAPGERSDDDAWAALVGASDEFDVVDLTGESPPPPTRLESRNRSTLVPQIDSQHWNKDLLAVYDFEHTPEYCVDPPSLSEMLQFRYGWLPRVRPEDQNPTASQWAKIEKIMGHINSDVAEWSYGSLATFVNKILDSPADSLLSSGLSWDFDDSSPSSLRALIDLRLYNTVYSEKVEGNTLYFVEPVEPRPPIDVPWKLVVTNAASACQCIRQVYGPSRKDIAQHLVQSGIPFLTLQQLQQPQPLHPSRHLTVCLGHRPENYVPDLADYAAYVEARQAFLRLPRGRAALTKGGIVWRLAIEILGDNNAVLEGPSADVLTHGHCVKLSNGDELWDDDLSTEELDLICGVYHVATGKFIY